MFVSGAPLFDMLVTPPSPDSLRADSRGQLGLAVNHAAFFDHFDTWGTPRSKCVERRNRPSHNLLFAGVLLPILFCSPSRWCVPRFNGGKISHTSLQTRTPGGGTINAISRLIQQDGMV